MEAVGLDKFMAVPAQHQNGRAVSMVTWRSPRGQDVGREVDYHCPGSCGPGSCPSSGLCGAKYLPSLGPCEYLVVFITKCSHANEAFT